MKKSRPSGAGRIWVLVQIVWVIGADVFVDLILKDFKRPHWLEDDLVEIPDVEVVPKGRLGLGPQL